MLLTPWNPTLHPLHLQLQSFSIIKGIVQVEDVLQNDGAFLQDGCVVSAVSTPTLFRCQMVCRLVKLDQLFGKKSVCRGVTNVVSQPRNGSETCSGVSGNSFAANGCNTLLSVLHLCL